MAQILNSQNPYQMIMNSMNPIQQQMAKSFLSKPNREQALKDLMKEHNVSPEQVESIKKLIK